MDQTRIAQQTSTALPLHGELTHDAPSPRALLRGSFQGPLQWALEGPGWALLYLPSVILIQIAARPVKFEPSQGFKVVGILWNHGLQKELKYELIFF